MKTKIKSYILIPAPTINSDTTETISDSSVLAYSRTDVIKYENVYATSGNGLSVHNASDLAEVAFVPIPGARALTHKLNKLPKDFS